MTARFKRGEYRVIEQPARQAGGEVVEIESTTETVVAIPGVGVFDQDHLPTAWQYAMGRMRRHLGLPAPRPLN